MSNTKRKCIAEQFKKKRIKLWSQFDVSYPTLHLKSNRIFDVFFSGIINNTYDSNGSAKNLN